MSRTKSLLFLAALMFSQPASSIVGLAGMQQTATGTDAAYIQLRAGKLSGDTVAVTDLTLRRDAATFLFKSGAFFFLEPVLGKVPGAVFIGDGELRMSPPIDVEKRSLSNATGKNELREAFSEVVLHFTDRTFEEVTAGMPPKKEAPNSRAASVLDSRLQLLRKGRTFSSPNIAANLLNTNLEARLLADLYDPGHAGFFNAFIKGKTYSELMFRIDPRGVAGFAPEEVILASFNDLDLGVWTAFHLKDHYAQGQVGDEDHRLMDVEHQQIDATIGKVDLSAKTHATIRVLADGPRVFRFDLLGSLRVVRVSEGEGRPLIFIQEPKEQDSDLVVIFPESLKKGVYSVGFEYSGKGALSDDGEKNYSLTARENWYPTSQFGDRATYDMTFHFPKDLDLVASGQPMETRQEGNQKVSRWVSDTPIAAAGFNYGAFKRTETKLPGSGYVLESYADIGIPDDLRAITSLGPLNTTGLMRKAQAEAEIALNIYFRYFGALPYGRLAMAQQSSPDFGQAWPMLVYMPITSYLDTTTRHQLGLTGVESFFQSVSAHEVAHQWWGHLVGWKSYRDQWMSEGFAEFSASLFTQVVYKDDGFRKFWKERREEILQKTKAGDRPSDVGSVTMGYRIDTARTPGIARRMIYPKGAYILHMVRMMMYDARSGGDTPFIAMMNDFVKTHFNQDASTEDFKKAVEAHMTAEMDMDRNGKMDWFFNEFVYGTEIPHYKLEYQTSAEDGKTLVKLRITQSEVSNAFKMLVPLYIETPDKRIVKLGSVRLAGNSSQETTIPLDFTPRNVLLCANEDVLGIVD